MSRRVCLLGGETWGKTTLAVALGCTLGEPVVEEYGRELWLARAGALTWATIGTSQRHVQLEEDARRCGQSWVILDTSPLTTLFYSLDQFGYADPSLQALAMRRYEVVLLSEPDISGVQDGARRDPAFRQQQHEWYEEQLRGRDAVRCGHRIRAGALAAGAGDSGPRRRSWAYRTARISPTDGGRTLPPTFTSERPCPAHQCDKDISWLPLRWT